MNHSSEGKEVCTCTSTLGPRGFALLALSFGPARRRTGGRWGRPARQPTQSRIRVGSTVLSARDGRIVAQGAGDRSLLVGRADSVDVVRKAFRQSLPCVPRADLNLQRRHRSATLRMLHECWLLEHRPVAYTLTVTADSNGRLGVALFARLQGRPGLHRPARTTAAKHDARLAARTGSTVRNRL